MTINILENKTKNVLNSSGPVQIPTHVVLVTVTNSACAQQEVSARSKNGKAQFTFTSMTRRFRWVFASMGI